MFDALDCPRGLWLPLFFVQVDYYPDDVNRRLSEDMDSQTEYEGLDRRAR